MQIYVHINGKNYGAYTVDQLRQYVQAGSFKEDHLACYDGTNWVKIRDVPGFAVVAKKAKPVQQKAQQKAPQKTKKVWTKKLLVLSVCMIFFLALIGFSIVGVGYYLSDDEGSLVVSKALLGSPGLFSPRLC